MSTFPHPNPTDAAGSAVQLWLPARWAIRRRHDSSIIGTFCGLDCAGHRLDNLTRAELIGSTSPGPLQRVWGEMVDLSTGKVGAWTTALTPLNGEPTNRSVWP